MSSYNAYAVQCGKVHRNYFIANDREVAAVKARQKGGGGEGAIEKSAAVASMASCSYDDEVDGATASPRH